MQHDHLHRFRPTSLVLEEPGKKEMTDISMFQNQHPTACTAGQKPQRHLGDPNPDQCLDPNQRVADDQQRGVDDQCQDAAQCRITIIQLSEKAPAKSWFLILN